jgi:hypothetical protein
VPRLSIVIPWKGPAEPFEATLAAVLQNRPAGCEILVALAAPYDDPYELGDEVTFLPPLAGSLVELINSGIAAASAPVVQVVPSGLNVTEGWTSAVLLHFDDPDVAAVAPVLVREQDTHCVDAAGLCLTPGGGRKLVAHNQSYNVSALVNANPQAAPLCGGFFRKSVVEALGGFDERLNEQTADLDFALMAQQLELRVVCEPTAVVKVSQSTRDDGSFGTGCGLERVWRRHGKQAAALHYLRWFGELAYGLIRPRWLAHLAGRVPGCLASCFESSLDSKLQPAQERLAAAAPRVLRMPAARVERTQRKAA